MYQQNKGYAAISFNDVTDKLVSAREFETKLRSVLENGLAGAEKQRMGDLVDSFRHKITLHGLAQSARWIEAATPGKGKASLDIYKGNDKSVYIHGAKWFNC